MQKIIKCTVSGEYVRGSGVVAGAAGSHDDVVLELAFKDIWEGTTKTAFWWDANGENPTATILTLAMLVPGETEVYRVPIPGEAKAYEGQMKLTLRGVVLSESGIVEQQATVSADAYFEILPGSVPDEYKDAMEVTPSVAEQIQAGVDALKGEFVEAQDAERNAIDAADRAKQSEENASESERISRASKETALEAANAAETSSASANAAAVVAEKAKDDAANSEYWAKQSENSAKADADRAEAAKNESVDLNSNTAYNARIAQNAAREVEENKNRVNQLAGDAAISESNALDAAARSVRSEQSALEAADRAEQAILANGYAEFDIGEDGHLYLLRTTNIADTLDFNLKNGRLEVVINE